MRNQDEKERHNMKHPNKHQGVLTEDGERLSASELQFIRFLVECGQPKDAYAKLVEWEMEQKIRTYIPKDRSLYLCAMKLLQRPDIQKEYWTQMEEVREHDVADATEVMMYFTQVMRGEIKDQFGLDASLSDRTQAAKELAKRTIDMENRMAGKPDAVVSISLDWDR